MKKNNVILTTVFTTLFLFSAIAQDKPPKAPSQPVTETYFGKQVTDPFRNLENLSDSTVMNWYKTQAKYTEEQLMKIPLRQQLFNELKDVNAKFKYTININGSNSLDRRKNYTFYVKQFSNEQTGKLYYRLNGSTTDVLLFDANQNNKSGILNVITGYRANPDGSSVSVVVISQGNEVGHLYIIDTKQKKIVETVERIWEPAEWLSIDTYTYSQFVSSDVTAKDFLLNQVCKKHKIGTNLSDDPILLSHKHFPSLVPDSAAFPWVTFPHKNSRFVAGNVSNVDRFYDVFLASYDPKKDEPFQWYTFIRKNDQISLYSIQNDKAFALSVKANKKGQILLTSASKPDWEHAQVIAEGRKGSISGLSPFTITKNYLYYTEVFGVEQLVYRVKLVGPFTPELVKIPISGTVVPFSDSPIDTRLRIFVTSWIQPPIIYEYDEVKNVLYKAFVQVSPQVTGFENMEVEEVYVTSYDGIRVPLSIIKPKGIKKDGNNPVLIYGYGNYGYSMSPMFDAASTVFRKHGIIKAIAHVRGGGEFGEEWRLGGYKATKPNTWKDAIACTEYMIKEGYTQPSKLAIQGMSAGGILCGRALTERPDLYAVAIPQVGVLNTLRFEFTPNGPNHINEFGTVKDKEGFNNLYEMDSYMHIRDGVKYPATLITGGLNDPRVVVWQPGKFAARLQEASSSGKPVWLRIDMEGGHGLGSLRDQEFREMADILSFVLWQTSGQQTKVAKGF